MPPKKAATKLHQVPLIKGVGKYTKGQMFVRRRKQILEKLSKAGKLKTPAKIVKQKKTTPAKTYKFTSKKGVERTLVVNQKIIAPQSGKPRKRVVNTRNTTNAQKLRPSLVPGTVLILLSGRFAGKRVVFLKQLASGCLLVTGPFKLNGVPLRRVQASYVIATSTHVDVSKVDTTKVTDDIFKAKKVVKQQKKKGEPRTSDLFVKTEKSKKVLPEEFKQLQIAVDTPVLAAVSATEHLEGYLRSLFSLKKGQFPHELKF
jgi:large subunit ribosomal protein L6e